jgi:hypothetical protein
MSTQESSAAPAASAEATPVANQSQEAVGTSEATNEVSSETDIIDAAAESGEITPTEAKELKKRLKLKVDGKEIEEEIDFNDDEALRRHLQKSKAFDTRNKEYTGFKSQVDQFFKQLQEDPESVLEQLGMNVDDMATKRLQRKVEEMQKSPEQLEKEKMAKELEKYRKEAEAYKKAQEEAQMETMKNKHAAEFENQISDALEKSKAKLPSNNPKVYAMIAKTMMDAIEAGYADVTVSDIIPVVERQWKEELRSYFDTSSEDIMEDIIGKQNLERLRNKRLAKRGKKAPTAPVKADIVDTGSAKSEPKESKKQTMRDFFKNL